MAWTQALDFAPRHLAAMVLLQQSQQQEKFAETLAKIPGSPQKSLLELQHAVLSLDSASLVCVQLGGGACCLQLSLSSLTQSVAVCSCPLTRLGSHFAVAPHSLSRAWAQDRAVVDLQQASANAEQSFSPRWHVLS
jgi:hypothetical protein